MIQSPRRYFPFEKEHQTSANYYVYLNTWGFFKAEFPRVVVMSSHNGEMGSLGNYKENYPICYSEGSCGFLSV